jgi:hypothetical protein
VVDLRLGRVTEGCLRDSERGIRVARDL